MRVPGFLTAPFFLRCLTSSLLLYVEHPIPEGPYYADMLERVAAVAVPPLLAALRCMPPVGQSQQFDEWVVPDCFDALYTMLCCAPIDASRHVGAAGVLCLLELGQPGRLVASTLAIRDSIVSALRRRAAGAGSLKHDLAEAAAGRAGVDESARDEARKALAFLQQQEDEERGTSGSSGAGYALVGGGGGAPSAAAAQPRRRGGKKGGRVSSAAEGGEELSAEELERRRQQAEAAAAALLAEEEAEKAAAAAKAKKKRSKRGGAAAGAAGEEEEQAQAAAAAAVNSVFDRLARLSVRGGGAAEEQQPAASAASTANAATAAAAVAVPLPDAAGPKARVCSPQSPVMRPPRDSLLCLCSSLTHFHTRVALAAGGRDEQRGRRVKQERADACGKKSRQAGGRCCGKGSSCCRRSRQQRGGGEGGGGGRCCHRGSRGVRAGRGARCCRGCRRAGGGDTAAGGPCSCSADDADGGERAPLQHLPGRRRHARLRALWCAGHAARTPTQRQCLPPLLSLMRGPRGLCW